MVNARRHPCHPGGATEALLRSPQYRLARGHRAELRRRPNRRQRISFSLPDWSV